MRTLFTLQNILGNKAEVGGSRLGTANSLNNNGQVAHRLSRLQTPTAQQRLEIDEVLVKLPKTFQIKDASMILLLVFLVGNCPPRES